MKLVLVFMSVSGEAGALIIPPEKTDISNHQVCLSATAVVRRQADQGPGQFDLLGQVFSSFRKFC